MKYSSSLDAYTKTGSTKPYYKQFNSVKPELGCTYSVIGSGIIKKRVKIIAIVENVAIGKVIYDDNGNTCKGDLNMYHLDGDRMGWQYNEKRPSYRLQKL